MVNWLRAQGAELMVHGSWLRVVVSFLGLYLYIEEIESLLRVQGL